MKFRIDRYEHSNGTVTYNANYWQPEGEDVGWHLFAWDCPSYHDAWEHCQAKAEKERPKFSRITKSTEFEL